MKEVGDIGPIYTETDMSQFPVEPFNVFSNLFFLAVVIYWVLKIKNIKDKEFKRFLIISMPILFIGYIGGTVYHATRSHNIWLFMDVLPIFILSVMVAVYMWKRLVNSYWKIAGYIVALIAVPRIFLHLFLWDSPYRITFRYIFLSFVVLVPMLIYEQRRAWKGRRDLLMALGVLILAVVFRALDISPLVQNHFPIGTHWLWHCFGGITTHLVLAYLYRNTLAQLD